ncbi:3751_t:CDS:1, partial [Dentiscutata heterogama]
CHQKLDLTSAKDQHNKNEYYQNNENNFFLNNTIELDSLEEFISTKLEACENNEDGIEINLHIILQSEKFSNIITDFILQEIINIIQIADSYK